MGITKKTFFSLLIVLSLYTLIPSVSSYDTDEDSGSLTLTELNFHDAIKEYKQVLVNFHALWCRYSKKLKPEWKNLVKTLEKEHPSLKTAKVEAYDEKKLAEEYGVEGYPTIKLFIEGKPRDYHGERTEKGLLEFVQRQLKSPLTVVNNVNTIEDSKKEYEWIGVLVGNSNEEAVQAVAVDHGTVLFVKTTADAVKTKYGASEGQFVLVRNISDDSVVLKDGLTESSLNDFITKNRFVQVPKFSKGTAERIFLSEDPSLILLRKDNADGKAALQALEAASGSVGLFTAVANWEDDISKLLAQNLGIDESELPTVRIVRADRERIRKYKMNDNTEITSENIKKFYEDYKNKKAQRFYLSEPVPADQPDLVTKVVTKEFKDLVLNADKDVLLLIWTPWCGHCRSMMPVYDNVARKTKNVANFLIGKIDASVNDLEGFGLDIVEYPTILLFTRKDKENPIEFKGERNEYVFNDFIRAHASVDLSHMKGPNPFDRNEL